MLDIEMVFEEFDNIMHNMLEFLISECLNDNDDILNLIHYYIRKINEIAHTDDLNYVYEAYPFFGLINPFNKNIKAVDELQKLSYDLKQAHYYNEEFNRLLTELLNCEKKALIILCRYYIPKNKQCEWMLYAENKVGKRNLLKGMAYNFYYTGVLDEYELILANIFSENYKDEYKIPILQALLDYHYEKNELKNTIKNVLQIK